VNERTHSFGYWLRRRRKALDLTQEALARDVSCSRFAIRKIEADERRPSRRLAERLAERLAIPPEDRGAFLDSARALRKVERMALDQQPVEAAPVPQEEEAGPFVGRGNEYGLLIGLLAHLTGGTGHVVLLEGEPGIGKSRLMRELSGYARSRGLQTLATRCYEIERAMPYQPVIDLVTQAVELASPAALQKLAPVSLAEIAALVPAVAERVAVPHLSSDFPEARRARLFRAVAQLFEALAGGRQVVVMVDDVQWADDASAQFLHFLARQAASQPLLLLCAYRDEALQTEEQLAVLVASLRREAHARHMPLARLQLADTRALLEGFGDAELAARLHRETEGNPFFLTSMLHALREGEIAVGVAGELPLPDALLASVRGRLAHVPAEARPTLDVAAVLGRHFDFDTLLAVTREPEERLLSALEALVARRLLREDAGEGFYDFSHDKVREVAYRDIGAARRMLLHRAVAEALERGGEGDARLAEHYERGHVWAKALHYMVLAGERSQKLFAMRDALHWLARAVELAEAHPEALQERTLAELYERRGAARAQAGQTEGAVTDFRRVIEAARARSDRAKARDGLIQLGMTYRRADDYESATTCLNEALAECRAMNDERRAADTLYHLGTVMWSDCRNREAIAFHEEAVAVCERLGLTDLVAVQAYHGRGEAYFNDLEPLAAIACYERSIELARGIGDKSYECENLMMVAWACTGYGGLGDYARAAAVFQSALDIAQRADLQWHMGPTLLGMDHVRACTGSYGEAWKGMTRTLRWLESTRQTRYQLIAYDLMGYLLIDIGQHERAVELSERALALASAARITFWRPRIEANLAIASIRLGLLHVGPLLENAMAEARANREGTQGARCLEGLAELAFARGDAAAALRHADELLTLAQRGGLKELAANARRLRGEALAAGGDRVAGAAELALAAEAADQVGRVRLALDATLGLAKLASGGGHAARAQALAARVRDSLHGSGLKACA
jgi:tetratricopeptide (TPR) repeat protein/transcriptional regulator with XRE-family HTH domain